MTTHDMADDWETVASNYKERITNIAQRADTTFGIQEKYGLTRQYAADHPLVAMATLVTMAMCSVPILCFMAFVLGTLFCTFMGFLFVEGLLLSIGGVMLCFVLCVAGLMSILLSVFLAISWLSFQYGSSIIQYVMDRYHGSVRPHADPAKEE